MKSNFYDQLSNYLLYAFNINDNWIREIFFDYWQSSADLHEPEILTIKETVIHKLQKGEYIKLRWPLQFFGFEFKNRQWNNLPAILVDLRVVEGNIQIKWNISEQTYVKDDSNLIHLQKLADELLSLELILNNIKTFVSISFNKFKF